MASPQSSGVNPKYKKRYRVGNWQAYERGGRVKPATPRPQQWIDFSIGRTNFWLSSTLNVQGSIRVALVLGGQDAKTHYQLLLQEKDQIEEEIDEELLWHELLNRKQSQIRLQNEGVDPRDRALIA